MTAPPPERPPTRLRRVGRIGALAALAALLAIAAFAAPAGAAVPQQLVKAPEDGLSGEAAGELNLPHGVAADPNPPGHLYVADGLNNRISEFTAWGEFVKAWGWGVDAAEPKEELQSCSAESGCQKGTEGTGAGQFKAIEALAVDGSGNVYAIDILAGRVQRFDPDGGPEGEATLLAGFGETGAGEGQLGGSTYRYRVAACRTDDDLFVGEGERIQRFDSAGAFKGPAIAMPAGKKVQALATDADCNLYLAFEGEAGVHEIAPEAPYEELGEFEPESASERPRGVALDGAGNLYVLLASEKLGEPWRVQKYDAEGNCLTCGEAGEGGMPGFDRVGDETTLFGIAASGACDPAGEGENAYLAHSFVPLGLSYFRAYEVPDPTVEGCEPPLAPPVIAAQYAVSVQTRAASVRADINPRFWSGSVGTTTYYAQWGTAQCIEESGFEAPCASETPEAPGAVLGGGAVNEPVPTATLNLEGLEPGTTYAYRFVATSDGGGPVFGPESRLRTYRSAPSAPCANDAYRTGAAALLPDCRAYELVSPLDKQGADIVALPDITTGLPATLYQSAADGSRIAYGAYRAFGDAASAPRNAQYVATRKAGVGWATHGISPPMSEAIYGSAKRFENEVRAFSSDLCTAWVQTFGDPQPSAEAPEGFSDLYRRTDEECGGPGYVALNTTEPATEEPFYLELQGRSADGLTAVFTANDALAPGASSERTQLYGARSDEDGEEHVQRMLCVLPSGLPISGDCTAGGNTGSVESVKSVNRKANLQGAASEDGERVFWTASSKGPGSIYVREHPFASGLQCASATAPCTHPVSAAAEALAGFEGSQFRAAAADGSRVLFTTDETLYEYDLEAEETTEIAGEVSGFLGAGEDASRSYFLSREARAPGAEAGKANLYFHGAGGFQWIGVLEGADLELEAQSPVAPQPYLNTARVSAGGLHAALTAQTPLTGYDNADVASGEADAEVYLYDAGAEALLCASCNPSGARPRGKVPSEGIGEIRSAARLPVHQNSLYGSRLLSADGERLFFLAQDALLPTDTNGREDLYQWQAPGKGTCNTESATYSPANAGCIDLISSGQAPLDVRFLDADETGANVFFTTPASLLSSDYGLTDVYDARANGGLPAPAQAPPECEGETCQSPAPSPQPAPLASRTYEGPGDISEASSRCTAPARKARRLSRRAKALRGRARRARPPRRARALRRRAARLSATARGSSKSARRCRARARARGGSR